MEIRTLKKSDVNFQKLAELTLAAMKGNALLTEEVTVESILHTISERLVKQSHDLVFIAEECEKIVGWLAFYKVSDLRMAQIWNWHPAVLQIRNENKIACELIRAALSHLREIGLHEVTVDFPGVGENTQPILNKYLNWYSKNGITEIFEEKFYKKNISEENFESSIPSEYSLGYIIETDLQVLFNCWVEIFSSSEDKFFLSLDVKCRKDFFFKNWSREKPLIKEASLTLSHKGKLIGFSRLLPTYESTDGCLAGMGILPEYRRKGLAQELLRMSMLKLREANYQTISFFVSTNNTPAICFYEKLGFKPLSKIVSLFSEI